MIDCSIDKLVFGGQGFGTFDGKKVFAWNALPGEEAVIWTHKMKRDYIEGVALEIKKSSPDRQEPLEEHFLSCSPWQVLKYTAENKWKSVIANETFQRFAGISLPNMRIVHTSDQIHYRNKMEYSVTDHDGKISLAFYRRGMHKKTSISGCVLAPDVINKAAEEVIAYVNNTSLVSDDIKSIILRSTLAGTVHAALFVKTKGIHPADADAFSHMERFKQYYSNPERSTSTPDELLYESSDAHLSESVFGKRFTYDVLSFFQVNLPLFEKCLAKMQEYIQHDEVVDYFCGAGVIGITLSDHIHKCILIESDESLASFAGENIRLNGLDNYTVISGKAEKLLEEIKTDRVIIFDPPRPGLHHKTVRRIIEEKPKRIMYLSCNVSTQARDIGLLLPYYSLVFNELYNFFPRTPHIESLCILDRK
ncbi:class I SAM-dependent RNA methyltransferase [Spirochaetota bacterium]